MFDRFAAASYVAASCAFQGAFALRFGRIEPAIAIKRVTPINRINQHEAVWEPFFGHPIFGDLGF